MVGTDDMLNSLAEDAYAAALDESLWEPLTWRLMEALDGMCCGLGFIDLAQGTRRQAIAHRNLTRLERYIDERMDELDPQVRHVLARPGSRIYLDTDYLDLDDPATAEHASWLRSNGGLGHHMSGIVLLENSRHIAGLTIHRPVGDGATPAEDQRKLAALMPRIAHAMQLGHLHGEKLASAYWDGLTAGLTEPALLLDECGKLLRLSPAMAQVIATADGLDVTAGRLRAAHPADDRALDAAIRRTLTGAAATLRITRRSGRAAYIITLYPLPRQSRMLAPAEAAILVTVIDPAIPPPASTPHIRAAFDLTPREAEMAIRMMEGHSVESAATVMAIGLPTARVHLRRILQKTGTARQSELVRLLARFR